MSSVSFPQSYSQGAPSSSSSEVDGPYYSHLPFESSSTGGFQINPLSPHPPRTPRTSIVAPNATVFHSEVFTSKEELEERPVDLEEEIDDTENSPLAKAKQRVRREDVWREMVLTSNGRDKAFVRYIGILCGVSSFSTDEETTIETDSVRHSRVLGLPLFPGPTLFLEGSRFFMGSRGC